MENVPAFIPPKRIQRAANKLLNFFSEQSGWQIQVPIPLDDIVKFIDYRLEYDQLETRTGESNVLGMIKFKSAEHPIGQIWIDESLANDETRIGQYNYTVGHELGHYALHGPNSSQFIPETNKLVKKAGQFICQPETKNLKKAPEETQADMFSANLFMPESLIRAYFGKVATGYSQARLPSRKGRIIWEMKNIFESSFEAMSNRLNKLNCWSEIPAVKELIKAY